MIYKYIIYVNPFVQSFFLAVVCLFMYSTVCVCESASKIEFKKSVPKYEQIKA